MEQWRVLIVDDHPLMRRGITQLLACEPSSGIFRKPVTAQMLSLFVPMMKSRILSFSI